MPHAGPPSSYRLTPIRRASSVLETNCILDLLSAQALNFVEFFEILASSPGTRPRSDEPKPAPDWVAALTAEERAKPSWQRISCGLCNLDHIDRGALALTSCKEDGAMASMRTCEGWWDLPDRRPERAPIAFGVRRNDLLSGRRRSCSLF